MSQGVTLGSEGQYASYRSESSDLQEIMTGFRRLGSGLGDLLQPVCFEVYIASAWWTKKVVLLWLDQLSEDNLHYLTIMVSLLLLPLWYVGAVFPYRSLHKRLLDGQMKRKHDRRKHLKQGKRKRGEKNIHPKLQIRETVTDLFCVIRLVFASVIVSLIILQQQIAPTHLGHK